MNWKQLLKKHLLITKTNALSFMITDHNRNSNLLELSESIQPFNHEDMLIALSMQGQEKMIGFKETNDSFQLNFETPYEQFIFTLNDNTSWIRIIVTRYNLVSPILGKEENMHVSEHQGYIFQVFKSSKSKTTFYNSKLITPLDKSSGTILNKSNQHSFVLNLKDQDKTTLNIQFEDKMFVILFNDEVFKFKTKTSNPKFSQSLLSLHFENITHHGQYFYINDGVYKGVAEHIVYNYQTFLIKRLVYNFVHTITNETMYKEIQFFLIFNNNDGVCIEIKQPEIDTSETFISQVRGEFFDSLTELNILETNDDNIPTTWKIKYKNVIYYIYPVEETIHKIPFWILENEYFTPVKILIRNDGEEIGIGWIRYKNFEKEETVINRKLKRLFQPLERPRIEEFTAKTFPIESILPSLFFIFFIIFVIVLIITTFVMFIILMTTNENTIPEDVIYERIEANILANEVPDWSLTSSTPETMCTSCSDIDSIQY